VTDLPVVLAADAALLLSVWATALRRAHTRRHALEALLLRAEEALTAERRR
jgi:hypothetical protein